MLGGWTSDQLFIRLLTGGDLIIVTQRPVQLRGVNPRALLVLLALRAGESVARDVLAGLLWPDTDQQTARNRLVATLFTLRRALSPIGDGLLSADRETVALTCGKQCVDVGCFRDLIATNNATQLQSAIDLYHGDLLVGFPTPSDAFEDLLSLERQALRDMALEAGYALIARCEDDGDFDALRVIARNLLAREPADERIYRAIIRTLIAQGELAEALKQFNRLHRELDELGAPPSDETLMLVRGIQDAVPDPELSAISNNPVRDAKARNETHSGTTEKRRLWPILLRFALICLLVMAFSIAGLYVWRLFRAENKLYMAPVVSDLCGNPSIAPDVQSLVYRALQIPKLKPEIGDGGTQPVHRIRAMMNCAGNDFRLLLEFHHSGSHIVCWIRSYEGRYPDDLESLRIQISNDIRDQVVPLLQKSESSCR